MKKIIFLIMILAAVYFFLQSSQSTVGCADPNVMAAVLQPLNDTADAFGGRIHFISLDNVTQVSSSSQEEACLAYVYANDNSYSRINYKIELLQGSSYKVDIDEKRFWRID